MRKRVDFKDAVGKTVEAVHEPTAISLIVLFSDGTYSHVSCDDTDDYLSDGDYEIDTENEWDIDYAVKFGIITRDEAAAMVDAGKREKAERQDKADREAYERLKEKYG